MKTEITDKISVYPGVKIVDHVLTQEYRIQINEDGETTCVYIDGDGGLINMPLPIAAKIGQALIELAKEED